jgi:tetraacyldisaccharide 4'-kinase
LSAACWPDWPPGKPQAEVRGRHAGDCLVHNAFADSTPALFDFSTPGHKIAALRFVFHNARTIEGCRVLSAAQFHNLVSGRSRGLTATLLRSALRFAEVPYALAMRLRNWQYDTGRRQVHRVEVPVISVGNLSLGGTGKTPLVAYLARWLRERGVRVAIVSRGYGAGDGACNDEALELEQQLPDVPHVQNRDRVAAARLAIEELESQCILLDDAFQHRRLARDLDIVLLDALEPFGFGHVFPRGTLREPLSGIARAQCVVLSRADLVDAQRRQQIRQEVLQYAPHAAWVECAHAPAALVSASGRRVEFERLRGQPVAAFCGIGNPAAFRCTLQQCEIQVIRFREFPDHHAYQRDDVEQLASWVAQDAAMAAVCTQKDLVKLGIDRLGRTPLWALAIQLQIQQGGAGLEQLLEPLVCRALQK